MEERTPPPHPTLHKADRVVPGIILVTLSEILEFVALTPTCSIDFREYALKW